MVENHSYPGKPTLYNTQFPIFLNYLPFYFMSSNKIKENDYEKATLMAKEIAALGRRDTKFFRWK